MKGLSRRRRQELRAYKGNQRIAAERDGWKCIFDGRSHHSTEHIVRRSMIFGAARHDIRNLASVCGYHFNAFNGPRYKEWQRKAIQILSARYGDSYLAFFTEHAPELVNEGG